MPNRILVLSLTRMGDIVQSIPFFKRLRLKHPGAEIHVLVEDCFADVAGFLPGVDRIHRVRLEDLLPSLSSGQSGDLVRGTTFYHEFVDDLRSHGFTEVWNLTHTRPSMVLNFLLAGAEGRGVTLDSLGLQRVNAPWLRYFFATNLARPWCQFNLVDVYANCVEGVAWRDGRELRIEPSLFTDALPAPLSIGRHRMRVAVHAGASQATKQWPVDSYRKVAERLAARSDLDVVLIGGKRDAAMSEAFQTVPRLIDLIGQTDARALAATLAECQLLISNDSGPMHIAAAVGTRVLDLTVGTALASETAPYGEGHIVVEPESDCFPCSPHQPCSTVACARQISPEAVSSLAEWQLENGAFPQPSALNGCRVYRTCVSAADGQLDLQLLNKTSCERDDLNHVVRSHWLNLLCRRPASSIADNGCVPHELQKLADDAQVVAKVAEHTAGRLAANVRHHGTDVPAIETIAALLTAHETRLADLLGRHGLLKSFLAFTNISRASIRGETLIEQAYETAQIYKDLAALLEPLANNPDQKKTIMHKVSELTEIQP